MGLFFNYEKEGQGIDKDAPKKKGIFLYGELLLRKFWLLMKANMLYFSVSLPIMAIYNIIIINALSAFLPQGTEGNVWQMSVVLTALITVLWGTGPVTAGYTYLLRNFAREEHAWIISDFFGKSRECFKLGITVLLLDIIVLIFGINAVNIYVIMINQGVIFAKYSLAVSIVLFFIYTFMHYYVYEFGVTFENRIKKTIKNACVMGIATLPANLFLTIFAVLVTFFAFSRLTAFSIIVLSFFIWISLMRFPIDFYTARMIKRGFIDTKDSRESGK